MFGRPSKRKEKPASRNLGFTVLWDLTDFEFNPGFAVVGFGLTIYHEMVWW